MTRAGAAGVRFRQRKLSTKHPLLILRENQVERIEDDSQRNILKVETGVDKGEETEHHLQAVISASHAAAVGGKVAQLYIPTPDTIKSNIQYDKYYSLPFSQPATYIRFSATVEESTGSLYCMSSEDDVFLKTFNQKDISKQCSEDQFEVLMNFFEEAAQLQQPYAAVDSPPVVGFEDMEMHFDIITDESALTFARDIYEYWRKRRLAKGNTPLLPALKSETGQDTDDSDPYVCFRRREVRQQRKTRRTDAQSTEKLRKLRHELESARQLISMVKDREVTRRQLLAIDRQVFEQRVRVKASKRQLKISGDDEDLINQKPQKKRIIEQPPARPIGTNLRVQTRFDGRGTEIDLLQLVDMVAERDRENQREIDAKVVQHRNWNNHWVDYTRAPLTPPTDDSSEGSFRTAIAQYLPTPPASESSENSGDAVKTDEMAVIIRRDDMVAVRYASPPNDDFATQRRPSFRRRVGRGGRLMIDRRGVKPQSWEDYDPLVLDRFRYDQEEEELDQTPTYKVDPLDTLCMRYRASMLREHAALFAARKPPIKPQQQDVAMANGQTTAGVSSSPTAHPTSMTQKT